MDFDLQEVFSILDENNEGQIQLRRFVDVANNYYSDAEVSFFFSFETTVQKKYETIKKKERVCGKKYPESGVYVCRLTERNSLLLFFYFPRTFIFIMSIL